MSDSIVVIQARSSSSRLPGKVLLPIHEHPLAVLVAKRAANRGKKTIVVTSNEPSDDPLCRVLEDFGQAFFRGSLNNTLNRFTTALSSYPDSTLVFRLTADNPVPDGALLEEVEAEFLSRGLNYLCCNGEESGLPYGVSVELMRLRDLRNAEQQASEAYDMEHVTPFIIRENGLQYFKKHQSLGLGAFRCTIDTFDDYLNIQELFNEVEDPVQVSAMQLIETLQNLPNRPSVSQPVSKLVMGGAQLGFHYGIANNLGQPSLEDAEQMIKKAINNGVEYIDTAHAYGESEAVIGAVLQQGWESRVKVITKLSPLEECSPTADYPMIKAWVESSVFGSCRLLRRVCLDCLMLHRAEHLTTFGGNIFRVLKDLKRSEVIAELGVSVQTPEELDLALETPEISVIQIPFNILDHRWGAGIEKVREVKKGRHLIIHVRSSLLQGLLLSEVESAWNRANVAEPSVIWRWLATQVKEAGRKNLLDLCLAYVYSQDWVDGVVVGMESVDQLEENIRLFSAPELTTKELSQIVLNRQTQDERLLNPGNWKESIS